MDRVPGYEPVGRGFESPQARHLAGMKMQVKAKKPYFIRLFGFFDLIFYLSGAA